MVVACYYYFVDGTMSDEHAGKQSKAFAGLTSLPQANINKMK
jgi:hypothetical protein